VELVCRRSDGDAGSGPGTFWALKCNIPGQRPGSLAASATPKQTCPEHLHRRTPPGVIGLLEHPQLTTRDRFITTPSSAQDLSMPVRKIVGGFSNIDRVPIGPGLRTGSP
jgi:hypothetical protein